MLQLPVLSYYRTAVPNISKCSLTTTPTEPITSRIRTSSPLIVSFGQATFDAEGLETPGAYFSRAIHWPGGLKSGVTIGRGYDMGLRTPLQVQRELEYAGVNSNDAIQLSRGAGLRGSAAQAFVSEHRSTAPMLSQEAQKQLFEVVVTPEIINDIRRILTKPDVVERYGATEWRCLRPEIQELLFDLRYRGDYTPDVREQIQEYVVTNNTRGLTQVMRDTEFWRARGVTDARMTARLAILEG
jgi:hypothetical protein